MGAISLSKLIVSVILLPGLTTMVEVFEHPAIANIIKAKRLDNIAIFFVNMTFSFNRFSTNFIFET
jgi:hypothetical protein